MAQLKKANNLSLEPVSDTLTSSPLSAYKNAQEIKKKKKNIPNYESQSEEQSSTPLNERDEKLKTYRRNLVLNASNDKEDNSSTKENTIPTQPPFNRLETFRNALNKKNTFSKERDVQKKVQKEQKMTGISFYLVLLIGTASEILTAIFTLSVFTIWLSYIISTITALIVGGYFYANNVKPDSRKITTWLISGAIELIPFLNVLPTFPFVLWITRYLENKDPFLPHL